MSGIVILVISEKNNKIKMNLVQNIDTRYHITLSGCPHQQAMDNHICFFSENTLCIFLCMEL